MFIPLNRHVLVKRAEEEPEEKNSSFVLPDDYEKPKDSYEVVTVLANSEDSKLDLAPYDSIVVERSMINTIKANGQEYDLVLENYVYGIMHEIHHAEDH